MNNIMIIIVDALRARNLGAYGYDKPTSPNIDEIANDGILFKNAFSCANCTDPSLTTILSGKHPLNHGVVGHGTPEWEENYRKFKRGGTSLLHQNLSDEYNTYLFDLGIIGPWLREGWIKEKEERARIKRFRTWIGNFLRNFKPLWRFSQKAYRKIFGFPDPRISADELTDSVISTLEGAEPFFAMVHYWDGGHVPYTPPKQHREVFDAEEYEGGRRKIQKIMEKVKPEGSTFSQYFKHMVDNQKKLMEVWKDYDACVRNVDHHIGRLVRNLSDDTLLIITSDHGENLGIDSPIYFSHAYLYDTTTHVPLILSHPSLSSREIGTLASHVDIVPTVMDLLNLEPPEFIDGVNLLSSSRGAVSAEMGGNRARMVRTDNKKLILPLDIDNLNERYWYDGDGNPELYDLRKDPSEERNLAEDSPEMVKELRSLLEEKVREYRTRREKSRVVSRTIEFSKKDEEVAKGRLK